jgi:hypothetical protein
LRPFAGIPALDMIDYIRLIHQHAGCILSELNSIYCGIVTPAVAAAGVLGDGVPIGFPSAGAALGCAAWQRTAPGLVFRDTRKLSVE